jgi:hypothetical protein
MAPPPISAITAFMATSLLSPLVLFLSCEALPLYMYIIAIRGIESTVFKRHQQNSYLCLFLFNILFYILSNGFLPCLGKILEFSFLLHIN